jgi:hypothetical protein
VNRGVIAITPTFVTVAITPTFAIVGGVHVHLSLDTSTEVITDLLSASNI